MNKEMSIYCQFYTLICKAALRGFSDGQQALIELILQMQKMTDGIQFGNYNGWDSEGSLQRPIGRKDARPELEVIV